MSFFSRSNQNFRTVGLTQSSSLNGLERIREPETPVAIIVTVAPKEQRLAEVKIHISLQSGQPQPEGSKRITKPKKCFNNVLVRKKI